MNILWVVQNSENLYFIQTNYGKPVPNEILCDFFGFHFNGPNLSQKSQMQSFSTGTKTGFAS
jgi:hypothetical protein